MQLCTVHLTQRNGHSRSFKVIYFKVSDRWCNNLSSHLWRLQTYSAQKRWKSPFSTTPLSFWHPTAGNLCIHKFVMSYPLRPYNSILVQAAVNCCSDGLANWGVKLFSSASTITAPAVWNSLSPVTKSSTTITTFKAHLKTELFLAAYDTV